MANKNDNIISDISYTNKDFISIYNELLDLAKTLTNTWDPSQSNESDPGVLLLKLAAIVGDKNNYNIDKSILECFPLSVTQIGNARNLYDCLGYRMKWYQSATLGVSDSSNGVGILVNDTALWDELEESNQTTITIPAFTQICNGAGDIVYSTLKDIILERGITDILYTPVIQGVWQDYKINGNDNITLNNLDNNYRLYFPETKIAENGIFIVNSNTGADFFADSWEQVDNIESYASGKSVFSFGVESDGTTCYIQFPSDIGNLIGSGLNIRYIVTNGVDGNIKANTLTDFVNDLPSSSDTNTSISINEYLQIIQPDSITNGSDIESLSDAYKNYKRTIGTFNTLVTRKDYENWLYEVAKLNNIPVVSNSVVADRTNDINNSYYIQEWHTQYNTKKLYANGMTAYQIVLYLLKYMESISTAEDYDETFKPNVDSITLMIIEGLIDEIKSVQHDLSIPVASSSVKFNFQNVYTIKGTLLTNSNVSEEEAKNIQTNVYQALYTNFNSRQVEYGKELDYQEIVDIITNSDARIKGVVLSQFNYDTQLMYAEGTSKPINNTNIDIADEIVAKSVLAGSTQLFNVSENFTYDFGQIAPNYGGGASPTRLDNITKIESVYKATIPVEANPIAPLVIGENESLQLFAPKYNEIRQYVYCNYSWDGDSNIPADIPYAIPSGKTLEITYKKSDGTDGVASLKGNDGCIISATFEIEAGANSTVTGSNYIAELKQASITLPKGQNYILVSNSGDISTNNAQNQNDFPRILQDNEYLILPNSTKTELVIWGSGVQLSVNPSESLTLTATNVDLSNLQETDISKIEWNTLTDVLTATDMSIINLGTGCSVYTDESSPIVFTDNTAKTITTGKSIYYKESTDTNYYSKTSTTIQPWKIQSRLAINSSKDKNQALSINDYITISYGTNSTQEYHGTTDGVDIIPTYIVFDNSLALTGGEYQANTIGISKSYAYLLGTVISRVNGVLNLTANTTLNYSFEGGSTTETAWLLPVEISTSGDNKVSISNATIFEPGDTEIAATNLVAGTYVLHITHDVSSITFTIGTGCSATVGYITKLEGLNTNINYNDLNLTYNINDSNGDRKAAVYDIIADLNSNKTFNWTYKVPEDSLIECPITPESFWNTNHIYNNWVIPKIDFEKSSLKVNNSNIT